MKLEREQLFGHITLSRKADSKSLDYNENNLDSTGLKSGNRVIKENQKRLLFDLKDNERDAVQLSYLMKAGDDFDSSKLDCSKSVDESIAHREYKVTDFGAKLDKDSEFYMDKSVMECELPEFLVCYKESNNHAVKDICIDEGVPSQDKILFESSVNDKDGCTFVFPDNDQNKQVEIHIPTKFKSSVNSEKYDVNFCETKDLMQKGEVKYNATDKNANDVSKEKIFPGNVLLMQELGREKSQSRSTNNERVVAEQQTFQISSEITNPVSTSLVSASEESDNRSGRGLPSSTPVSVAELNNISLGNEFFYNNNVEKGSITFDFDSLASIAISKDECPYDGSFNCPETQNMTPVDGEKIDKIDTRGVSSQDHEGLAPPSVTRGKCPQNGGCGCIGTSHVSKVDDEISDIKIPSSQVQNELPRDDCPQNGDTACCETTNTSVVNGTSDAQVVSDKIHHGIDREECSQNVVCGCCETRTMPILEDEIPGSSTVSRTKPILEDDIPGSQTVSSRFQYGQGESSFSAAGPLSSLINFSGPIAYSGNISLRSDSSTTSTRSFAFPVLQSEWNSSPVRMAKADRRNFRKHRGWRQGLLCCRF
ncbi:uncharacterized protein LOC107408546 [Ziziphus jujuba]|uniref:Uncharacterized protein LOC107408546 n=1 Tax=Ziziphus jujuba TaxID=326968 RepID=A0ABM3I140_ZIZJJ|nr:uncharacterized protein LOC107408546 [Ziziphus jujuba]XP_048318456.2 uncharacterized protein LOC107408546 [Ziziphus jujuba]XP_048318457.2 uncharacterized protein LOC107408546 [Ziziphus jujuba]XP_048318458.2 uncharacterized protein LOC107408546 [Ziziphus jujuba]